MATNFNHNGSGSGEEDDEDRKLPAKEILVKNTKNPSHSNRRNRNDSNQSDTNFTVPTSTEASIASTASSVSAGWVYSPVARASTNHVTPTNFTHGAPDERRNRNSTAQSKRQPSKFSLQTPNASKGKQLAQNDMPSLVASTPASPRTNQTNNSTVAASSPWTSRGLQRQVILWLATVLLALAVFIYQVLPTAALATLLFIVASTGMMTQTLYYAARSWYIETVRGSGLGEALLPSSLVETLAETSLHEYMTAPSPLGVENLHLLLYFLPLTPAQLDESIRRLGPHHRERLFRRGLGHMVLGEPAMRRLLGEPRYRAWQQAQVNANVIPLDISTTSDNETIEVNSNRRLETTRQRLWLHDAVEENDQDDESDMDASMPEHGPDVLEESPPPLIAPSLATPPSSTNGATPDENNLELQVVMDALWNSAYGSIWNPMRDYMSSALIQPTVHTVSHWGRRLGLVASLSGLWWWTNPTLALGSVSILSMFTGGTSTNTQRHLYQTSWSSFAFGGVAMGFTWYARYSAQRTARTALARSQPSKEKESKPK